MRRNQIVRELRQELYRELNRSDPGNLRELRNHHQELRQRYIELCLQLEDLMGMTDELLQHQRGKRFKGLQL